LFGAVYRWIMECLAGLKLTSPAFDTFAINP
jgi:hypothetical protein